MAAVGRGQATTLRQSVARFAKLLRQAIQGVRDGIAAFNYSTKVMVHIDKGADPETAKWWLNRAKQNGIEYDVIGLSFYPLWHEEALLERLNELSVLAAAFPNKEIVIAETAYPFRPFRDKGKTYRKGQFPFTRDGQRQYLEKALEIIKQVPNGAGLFWWGATFINDAFEDCPDCFQAQALFDSSGIAMPALKAFQRY